MIEKRASSCIEDNVSKIFAISNSLWVVLSGDFELLLGKDIGINV